MTLKYILLLLIPLYCTALLLFDHHHIAHHTAIDPEIECHLHHTTGYENDHHRSDHHSHIHKEQNLTKQITAPAITAHNTPELYQQQLFNVATAIYIFKTAPIDRAPKGDRSRAPPVTL